MGSKRLRQEIEDREKGEGKGTREREKRYCPWIKRRQLVVHKDKGEDPVLG